VLISGISGQVWPATLASGCQNLAGLSPLVQHRHRTLIGLTAALPGREAEHGRVGFADTMDAEYTRRMFYGSHRGVRVRGKYS